MWQVYIRLSIVRSPILASILVASLYSSALGQPPNIQPSTVHSLPARQTIPPDSKGVRINDLALRIIAAEGEEAADAALNAEPELAGLELGRALLGETLKLRNTTASGERIMAVSLRIWRYVQRPDMRAARGIAHRALGLAYANLERWDLAEKELLAAIAFSRAAGVPGGPDNILAFRDLASVYYRKGDYRRASEGYEATRMHAEAAGDKDSVIQAYNGLAAVYIQSGDFSKAYLNFERSLGVADGIEDKTLKLASLGQLATAYLAHGRIGKAVETYDTAYRTALASASPASANYLFQSALAQVKLGDLSGAYSRFRKVLAEATATADRRLYLYSLLNIAWIHKQHAQEKKAIELYERTISLADAEIANVAGINRRGYITARAEAVNRLAEIQTERGDTQAAIDLYTRNLGMLQSAAAQPDPGGRTRDASAILEIGINTSLGDIQGSRGNHSEASAHFAAALALSEKIRYETGTIDTLLSLATHAARRGHTQEAFSYVDKVQLLVQKNGRLDQLLKLRTITAGIQRKLNRPAAADLTFQEAVRISETLRTDVTMPDQRASYFSSLFAAFDEYIDFLMERHEKEPDAGFDGKAFNVSERRRARALLDSLRVARTDIRHGVDPALLEQESRIRNQLNSAAREQFSPSDLSFKPVIDEDTINTPVVSPKADIALLTAELARAEAAIRQQSFRYAALMQPRPMRWAAIQTMLDEQTVLLNYTLGEKRSFLWTITQNSIHSFVLPPRLEIEVLVKRVYGQQSDSAGDGASPASFTSEAETLARILLEPAAATLNNKRIVIVADGALQYLPFSSLPDPRRGSTNNAPMLQSHEIQFAPSASVVAVLRQEAERRPKPPRSVAIFADPVFSVGDERFERAKGARPATTRSADASVNRDLFDARILSGQDASENYDIPRLPFSRREAEAIFSNSPAGTSFMAVDFEASREKVASIDLSKYGIVHFATHGILHSEHPELSGVVLSLFNEKAEPVNGFLRLNEIYNMSLNADLVVLSACQTALGKEVRGEGLIGLTRGFMYAGSPRVLASLWKVDDVATAELMKLFYQRMLKENMRPAAALRAAKIEMMQNKRWNSPYYWAAFELQGEWR